MASVKDALEYIRKEDAAIFVGSGCSLDSGAPSAKSLANQLHSYLPEDIREEVDADNLQRVCEAFEADQKTSAELKEHVRKIFSNLRPSRFHSLLMQIPHFQTIITTNYDTLIEDAYKCTYLQVIVDDKDCNQYDSGKVHLYKVHGDIHHLDKIIASKGDYRHTLTEPKDKVVWNKVISEIATKCTIFVGYGMEDDNVLAELEDLIKRLGDDRKKVFVVIPKATPLKKKQIQNLGASYIDSTGESFLSDVLDGLKDTFGYDRKHNVCSMDTSARFGLLNQVSFAFENLGGSTSIKSINSVSGPVSHNFHFNTKNKNILNHTFPNSDIGLIKGFNLPSYELSEEELKTFEYRVNGLKLSDISDTKKVVICPSLDDINLAYKSASFGISKKIKAKKYFANDEIHICVSTDFCRIEYILIVPKTNGDGINIKCQFTLNEEFHNLDDAICWARIMVAMTRNSDLKLYLNDACLGSCVLNDIDNPTFFDDVLNYCENIKAIEDNSDVLFSSYERYSPNGHFMSKIIRSYLTKTEFTDVPRKELKRINMVMYEQGDYNEENLYVARIRTSINNPLVLCKHEFTVPEERVLMMKCKITPTGNNKEGQYPVTIYPVTDKIQYGYYDADDPDMTDPPKKDTDLVIEAAEK